MKINLKELKAKGRKILRFSSKTQDEIYTYHFETSTVTWTADSEKNAMPITIEKAQRNFDKGLWIKR